MDPAINRVLLCDPEETKKAASKNAHRFGKRIRTNADQRDLIESAAAGAGVRT